MVGYNDRLEPWGQGAGRECWGYYLVGRVGQTGIHGSQLLPIGAKTITTMAFGLRDDHPAE